MAKYPDMFGISLHKLDPKLYIEYDELYKSLYTLSMREVSNKMLEFDVKICKKLKISVPKQTDEIKATHDRVITALRKKIKDQ